MKKIDYEVVEIDKKHYGHSYSKNMALLHVRRKGDRNSVCGGVYMNDSELSLVDWQLDYNPIVYCASCEAYAKKAILEAKHIPFTEEEVRESTYALFKQKLNSVKEQFTETEKERQIMPELGMSALNSELPPIQVPSLLTRVKQKVSESITALKEDITPLPEKIEPTLTKQEIADDMFSSTELPPIASLNEPKKILTSGGFSFLRDMTPEKDKDLAEKFHGKDVVRKVFVSDEGESINENGVDIPHVFRKSR